MADVPTPGDPLDNPVRVDVLLGAQDKLAECLGLHIHGPVLTQLSLPLRVETTGGDHLKAFAYTIRAEAGGGSTWFVAAHPYRDPTQFVFCIADADGQWDPNNTFTDREDYLVIAARIAGH